MEQILLVCTFFLVLQGSSAVTPVFVQTGEDVTLNLTTADVPENFILFSWSFKETILVTFLPNTEPVISEIYTGKIEFSAKTFSVKLKNLQEADSAVYTAQVIGIRNEQIETKYDVTVQDPVSPVKLKLDSVSNSSDSCNFTVTCSTQDSHISSTFICDAKTCSQEGEERSEVTTSGASLRVYLVNDLIICNHSNMVSRTNDMKEIRHFCPKHDGADKPRSHIIVCVVVPIMIVILIIIAAVVCLWKRGKDKRVDIENTVYAVPQVEATALHLDPTNDASGHSPISTYCLVGPHTGPTGSTETAGRPLPESLYAEVQKPGRS